MNSTCIWSAGRNTGESKSYVVRVPSDCATDAKSIGPETSGALHCPAGIRSFQENLGGSDDLKEGSRTPLGRGGDWIENNSRVSDWNQPYVHVFGGASMVG